jgi:hypothetical protein
MAYVTLAEVQQWLESTKLTVAAFDVELEATAREIVFSRVAAVYTTSTWTNDTNTPALIRKVMAMLVAAWTYQRAYSEDLPLDKDNWGVKVESMAMSLLAGIVDGSIDLGTPAVIASTGQPVFWPHDTSVDADGNPVVAKFAMGQVF